jgi:hypothetical protein
MNHDLCREVLSVRGRVDDEGGAHCPQRRLATISIIGYELLFAIDNQNNNKNS